MGLTTSFRLLLEHSVEAVLSHGTCPVNTNIIRLLPSLSLIVTTSAGLNQIDLQECRRRGISVDDADIAVGLLIDVPRKISTGNRYETQGCGITKDIFLYALREGFDLYVQGFQLGGKKVGIVGLGSIGQEAAKGLEHHGCNILYNSRTKKSSVPYPCYSNVCEVVANCEVLIICCELNDQTRHIISLMWQSRCGWSSMGSGYWSRAGMANGSSQIYSGDGF